MTHLERIQQNQDEEIIRLITKHRGLLRSVLDYLNQDEEQEDGTEQ